MVAAAQAMISGAAVSAVRTEPAAEHAAAAAAAAQVEKLIDAFSKLNPLAKEFVPSPRGACRLSADAPVYVSSAADYFGGYHLIGVNVAGSRSSYKFKHSGSDGSSTVQSFQKRRNGYTHRKRLGTRGQRVDREECIRRTVYVSDLDFHVTEERLASVFSACGQVVDCRICGDPHSALKFAFIEFYDEVSARTALQLDGTLLGFCPARVLPSKTAILPVNPKFLPRSDDEKDMVVRTIYCTNIDKKVSEDDVKNFFEQFCGKVSRLRLLSDYVHSTCFAFVEFAEAESAIAALHYTGSLLGNLPIRVSPSKTPVRLRVPRAAASN